MPKIKVYKHDGEAVPVDRAKVATAYECPFTGKIYLTKKSYLLHLKSYREEQIRKINRGKRINDAIVDLNSQPNFNKIIKWIETNSWFFLANAKRHAFHYEYNRWPNPEDFWIKIVCLDLQWSQCVSNSHSCPRNGVQNWSRHTDIPRGYPGWSGWFEFQTSHDLPGFTSDLFKQTGIHLGCGGGREKNRYGCEVRFYDSDWLALDKQSVFAILSEKKQEPFLYGKRGR